MEMNVITLGTFQIIHYGHLRLFKKCRELSNGGNVSVGLNTDKFVYSYKKQVPVMNFEERKKTILETGLVDRVVANGQVDGTVKKPIQDTASKLIVIGSDWATKDYLGQIGLTQVWIDKMGISICYVPYTLGISSSEIKKRLVPDVIEKTI